MGSTNILPASVSPPSHPNGRRSWIRIAGFAARNGPTEVRRGEPSARLLHRTHRPCSGCGRAREEMDCYGGGKSSGRWFAAAARLLRCHACASGGGASSTVTVAASSYAISAATRSSRRGPRWRPAPPALPRFPECHARASRRSATLFANSSWSMVHPLSDEVQAAEGALEFFPCSPRRTRNDACQGHTLSLPQAVSSTGSGQTAYLSTPSISRIRRPSRWPR
jgi:hypothetical protein